MQKLYRCSLRLHHHKQAISFPSFCRCFSPSPLPLLHCQYTFTKFISRKRYKWIPPHSLTHSLSPTLLILIDGSDQGMPLMHPNAHPREPEEHQDGYRDHRHDLKAASCDLPALRHAPERENDRGGDCHKHQRRMSHRSRHGSIRSPTAPHEPCLLGGGLGTKKVQG